MSLFSGILFSSVNTVKTAFGYQFSNASYEITNIYGCLLDISRKTRTLLKLPQNLLTTKVLPVPLPYCNKFLGRLILVGLTWWVWTYFYYYMFASENILIKTCKCNNTQRDESFILVLE